MFKKSIFTLAAAATVALGPVTRAAADGGDFAAGVVTGVLGTIIVNEHNKNKPPRRTVVVRPDSPQRSANRLTQTSLNYFGFNAGYADGVFGPATSRAVSGYQSYMGFPITGRLTPFENEVLVSAYNRAQSGDYTALQVINASPQGARALLPAQRDAMTGVAPASGSVTTASSDATPEQPSGGLLPLIPMPTGNGDLASFCSNGDVTGPRITLAAMTDPVPALNQAFCGARADAIDTSASLAASVQGVSMADIQAQCDQLGPLLQPYVSSLYSKPRADVVADVNGFIADTGADRGQLASTAQICLGTGYRTNNMNVAVGSGLLLVALGESGYGELMGHHLYHGFGTAKNQNRATEWLVWTTDELASGATPVFGDPARSELVDEAVFRLNGGAPANTPANAPASAAKAGSNKGKLPVIDVQN